MFLIFFSGSALYFYMNLKLSAGQSGFYYDEEWGKRQQLESFWEKAEEDTKKKIQEIALYRMEKNVQFYNPDLNRSVEGDLTEIAGGMQLIFAIRYIMETLCLRKIVKGVLLAGKWHIGCLEQCMHWEKHCA